MTRLAGGVRRGALAVGLALVLPVAARAQDPRLAARLDPVTWRAVVAIMDSARAARLPTQPLADKALEGAGKGADGARIVTAVRSLAAEMRSARNALGASSSADEIKAGANALHAGVPPAELARLRAAGGKRLLTMPLAVESDLVARDVPILVAADLVVRLTEAGVHDADFALFQRNVRIDIDRGADPSTAATTRARGTMLHASARPAGRRTPSRS